ncbi:MAG TPA: glycosyltransferase [Verrucomicrobiae bacterium]|nr:glycosyltransferase [Verrucomicrobiae bacterium]
MSAPKISVIIPVFNDAGDLVPCLQSLQRQTFRDFETIIVDDGSTEPVKGADIRFEKNKGAPAARNAGFAKSRGAFVLFLDDDAVLVPEALASMLEALEADTRADFAYPSFKLGLKTFKGRPYDEAALRREPYIHTSALIRREAFPGFDESLKKFQDWDLFLTMAEKGSRGVWIDKILFTLKPRGVMSRWMPRIAYDIRWPILGWTPRTIKTYDTARAVIAKKHGLDRPDDRGAIALGWFVVILLAEVLSLIAAFHPAFSSACALVGALLMFLLALKRPDLGLMALSVEFVIGSKGRFFALGADASADGGISWRILLFAAFFLGWGINAWQRKKLTKDILRLPPPYYFLAASVLLGVLLGIINRQTFLYADANAWLAFLLIFPALELAHRATARQRIELMAALRAALFWLCAKTILLFYVFSHDFGPFWEGLYLWVRRSGVGEVTILSEHVSAARVFIQSQVFAVFGALYSMMRKGKESLAFLVLCLATVLISFSRSFWIGLFAGTFVLLFAVLRRKDTRPFLNLLLAGVASLLVVFGVYYIPFPAIHGDLADVFAARADTNESAAASRWELLPVLDAKIAEAPLFGSGFGATVTYQSKDPRIVAETGGTYTTYAFEWGWHDLAVKLGLFGVFAYVWVLVSLFRRLGKAHAPVGQAIIFSLAAIHFFTPYLNYPLGILVIVLAEAWLVAYDTAI